MTISSLSVSPFSWVKKIILLFRWVDELGVLCFKMILYLVFSSHYLCFISFHASSGGGLQL